MGLGQPGKSRRPGADSVQNPIATSLCDGQLAILEFEGLESYGCSSVSPFS